jgi:hypothetical protein
VRTDWPAYIAAEPPVNQRMFEKVHGEMEMEVDDLLAEVN